MCGKIILFVVKFKIVFTDFTAIFKVFATNRQIKNKKKTPQLKKLKGEERKTAFYNILSIA